MSTITKEQVHAVSDLKAGYTLGHADVAILNELARIALASLEAEPVCYLTWHQGFRAPDDCEEYVVEAKPGDKSCDGSPAFPVYTAPPAPVSVPDFDALRLQFEASERKSDPGFNLHKYGIGYADKATQARWEEWVSCRAAMLQGVEGNSPVIPDGWVMVPVEPTHEMLEAGDEQFGTYDVYRRMIAAAPQQEP